MAVGTNLLVGVAMAVVLLGTGALLTRQRHWRHYAPSVPVGGYGGPTAEGPGFAKLLHDRNAWTVAYLVAFAAVAAGSWLYLDGSAATQSAVLVVLAAVAAIALLVFVMAGLYNMARTWGFHSASAVMVASFLLATVLVLGLAVKLLVAGG